MLDFLEKNKDITNLSNFRTKATSKYYYEINEITDLDNFKKILIFANKKNLKYTFIWWWTNILFAFENYNWIIIKNNLIWWNYSKKTKILESFSNESITKISYLLKKNYNQNMFVRFIWLPWSIWWAVFWNAWCFWLEISNNFLETKVLNLRTFEIEIFDKDKMNFAYRQSYFKENKNYFIISVKFDLSKTIDKYPIWNININDFRKNKQVTWNSCWSFFKNPTKELAAWYLIEKIWLKWYNQNGAYFSEKHANFLINDWTAKYSDLLGLINLAQTKIKKEFNLDLIPEVNIIYN